MTLSNMNIKPVMFLAVLLVGCGKPNTPQTVDPIPNVDYITLENRTPNLPDIDPRTISPDNTGYFIDLDGNGQTDFIILKNNNTLYFTKNNYGKGIPILTIKGNLMAYNISVLPGKVLPSLLFWDTNKKGYYQECLGMNAQGLPFFGNVEEQ